MRASLALAGLLAIVALVIVASPAAADPAASVCPPTASASPALSLSVPPSHLVMESVVDGGAPRDFAVPLQPATIPDNDLLRVMTDYDLDGPAPVAIPLLPQGYQSDVRVVAVPVIDVANAIVGIRIAVQEIAPSHLTGVSLRFIVPLDGGTIATPLGLAPGVLTPTTFAFIGFDATPGHAMPSSFVASLTRSSGGTLALAVQANGGANPFPLAAGIATGTAAPVPVFLADTNVNGVVTLSGLATPTLQAYRIDPATAASATSALALITTPSASGPPALTADLGPIGLTQTTVPPGPGSPERVDTLAWSAPSELEVHVDVLQRDANDINETTIDAPRVPTALGLTSRACEATGRVDLAYQASALTQSITVRATRTPIGSASWNAPQFVLAELQGVPPQLTVGLEPDREASFAAFAAPGIPGFLEGAHVIRSMWDAPIGGLDYPNDFVKDLYGNIEVRLTHVRAAAWTHVNDTSLATGCYGATKPCQHVHLEETHTGPFDFDYEDVNVTTAVHAGSIPDSLDIRFDPDTQLRYAASAPIAELTATVDQKYTDQPNNTVTDLNLQVFVDALPAKFDLWSDFNTRVNYENATSSVDRLRILASNTTTTHVPLMSLDLDMHALPTRVASVLNKDNGTFTYNASANLGSVRTVYSTAAPIGEGSAYHNLTIDAQTLPHFLNVSWVNTIRVEAGRDAMNDEKEAIPRVDFDLWDHPRTFDASDATVYALVENTTRDAFVHAHAENLSGLSVMRDEFPAPRCGNETKTNTHVGVSTTSGGSLHVNVGNENATDPSDAMHVDARIASMSSRVNVLLAECWFFLVWTPGHFYDVSGPLSGLTVDACDGNADASCPTGTKVHVGSPALPASFEVDMLDRLSNGERVWQLSSLAPANISVDITSPDGIGDDHGFKSVHVALADLPAFATLLDWSVGDFHSLNLTTTGGDLTGRIYASADLADAFDTSAYHDKVILRLDSTGANASANGPNLTRLELDLHGLASLRYCSLPAALLNTDPDCPNELVHGVIHDHSGSLLVDAAMKDANGEHTIVRSTIEKDLPREFNVQWQTDLPNDAGFASFQISSPVVGDDPTGAVPVGTLHIETPEQAKPDDPHSIFVGYGGLDVALGEVPERFSMTWSKLGSNEGVPVPADGETELIGECEEGSHETDIKISASEIAVPGQFRFVSLDPRTGVIDDGIYPIDAVWDKIFVSGIRVAPYHDDPYDAKVRLLMCAADDPFDPSSYFAWTASGAPVTMQAGKTSIQATSSAGDPFLPARWTDTFPDVSGVIQWSSFTGVVDVNGEVGANYEIGSSVYDSNEDYGVLGGCWYVHAPETILGTLDAYEGSDFPVGLPLGFPLDILQVLLMPYFQPPFYATECFPVGGIQ